MIIVCPNEIKKTYLDKSTLHNYKFYDLKKLKEKVFFKFHNLALYEVVKKYHVKPSIASKMLENLYYISKKEENSKLKKLYELKEYLIQKDLIIKDNNFFKNLKDEIVIEGYPKTKELEMIINVLSKYTKVTYKEASKKFALKEIYEFENADLEMNFVLENILKLLNDGVDINKIYIINANNDYIEPINKMFSLFNIPYNYAQKKSITMFPITKKFLKFIKNSDLKVCELNEFLIELKDFNNDEILNQIINVLNKYYGLKEKVKDLYEVIYFELKNTYLKEEKYKNAINILNNIQPFSDDDYVFAISLNEENALKDNDYLKDSEKLILGLDTSYELNQINDLKVINILSNIKNLTLSYKLKLNDNDYMINHNFDALEVQKYEFKYNRASYNKYLFDNHELYDNTYKKIDYEDLKNYLDNKLNLSYSSMDLFFKCKYRFFLNNILKIEPKEETMATKVGSMFHKILERTLKNNYENYLEIIDEESANFLNENSKEKFYGEKLKKEAIKIIERLKETDSKTDFKNFAFEKYLEISKSSDLNIKLIGFLDKILIFNDGINNYVIVIDYKTGTYSFDLAELKDGFSMQLLIYLYLIKNAKFLSNVEIAGAYVDSILNELKPFEFGKTYDEIVDNRLIGITTNNKEILSHIDKYYDVNSFIKGIKLKTDGDFYYYSKVYNESDFDKLLKIVDDNINKVIDDILKCDFKINPKRYSDAKVDEIIGCEYCKFKEICYMSSNNIEIIERKTIEEVLGD